MRNRCIHIIFVLLVFVTNIYPQDVYRVEKINVNLGNSSDFCPVFYKNGIVFCSNRKNDLVITYTDQKNRSLTGIYYAEKREDFKFSKPQLFAEELNTTHHDGPIAFSSDGSYAYITRNNKISKFIGNKIDPENKLGIYFAKNENGKFIDITLMDFCKEEYNYMHPCLSPDNQRIYFASDMPGGFGGYDLYYSEYKQGGWSQPKNLGPVINTPQDEAFPFIHQSGRLYFASKGHPGLGRFDIYFSDIVEDNWITPVHLKEPFNSMFDDFGYIVDANFELGYFSTARKRRQDDIYEFKSTAPHFDECSEIKENNYCFVFYEKGSMDIDTTSLKYEWDLGDGTKIRSLEARHCFDGPGQYLVQLNVIDTLTGDIYFSEASDLFTVEDIKQSYFTIPDKVYINEEIKLDGKKSYAKDFTIENYYWNFGDGNLDIGSTSKQTYLKPGEYTIKLVITGGGEGEDMQKLCNSRKVHVLIRK